MSWWERQISLGWKGPIGQPRGSTMAHFPLRTGTRYRVSMNPAKAHYLVPDEDYAFCGLPLAPDDAWLIDSGYDAYYWIVEDDRQTGTCGDCTRWKEKWRGSAQLPTNSPVTVTEWVENLGPTAEAEARQADMMAGLVADWFGHGARVQQRMGH